MTLSSHYHHHQQHQQADTDNDIAVVPRCIVPLLHTAHVTRLWVDRHACALDAYMEALRRHLPVTARAIVDQVTVIVAAHALVGPVGTVLLAIVRVAVRWLSWWVLP